MGSTVSSSSESDDEDDASNGSLDNDAEGIVLANNPSVPLLLGEELRRRLVGRSEAFRMVGLALRISDMMLL